MRTPGPGIAAGFLAILALLLSAPGHAAAQGAAAQEEKPRASGVVPAGVKLAAQMPEGAEPRPYAFPKAATRTLANGLRVYVVSDQRAPAVSVRLVLAAAGTVHDPAGKPGVASLAAQMLTQGTTTRSAQQIAEAIDFVGGSLSASAASDASYVSASVVKKDLPLALELVADVARNASFAEEELERQRQQLLSNLRIQYNDPDYLATAVFRRAVFGAHPYGLPAEGTPHSARAITRADLAGFRDARYAPNTALLAFAGDITPEAAFAAAEKWFGDWKAAAAPEAVPPAAARPPGLRIIVVDKPDAVQTQMRIGRLSIPRNHADFIPLVVANHILGGGFNSRLSTEVRIRKGLTYGAYSRMDARRAAGSLMATTFTRTEATAEAARLVVDLLRQMGAEGAPPEELRFATDYLAGVFPIQTETPEQVAERVLNVALYGLAADYNDTYRQRIRGVTPAEVRAVAARHIRADDLDLVLVGNAAAFREELKKSFPGARWEEVPFAELDLLSASLRRQEEPTAAASPEALARGQALLAAAAQAAGGAALSGVRGFSYTAAGELFTPQGAFPVEVKGVLVYPDRTRTDIVLPFLTASQGFDGTAAWVSSPQGTVEFPAQFNNEQLRGIDLSGGWGLLRKVLAGEVAAEFLGPESVEGRTLLAVAWNAPAGRTKLFLDPASGMLVGAAFQAASPQGTADQMLLWHDFREVEGLKFPFRVVDYRNGQKFLEQKIQEVKLNPAVEAAAFAKPS